MKLNFISFSLLLSLLLCGCRLATTTRGEAHQEMYLFSYFNGNGDGLHLAYSYDGLKWANLCTHFLMPVLLPSS